MMPLALTSEGYSDFECTPMDARGSQDCSSRFQVESQRNHAQIPVRAPLHQVLWRFQLGFHEGWCQGDGPPIEQDTMSVPGRQWKMIGIG